MTTHNKWIVLGTAGHIDHGKTTLVQALTGINTDRLKEEQDRGITIELGFAYLDLSHGLRVGIVDVPGHEKFVRHMVAGATGIDLVMLLVAADEGIMPQTREHFDICRLLGLRQGLVVVTKIDLVEKDWLDLVLEDIRHFVQGSFLEGAPIFPVSAKTGQGIPGLIQGLQDLVSRIKPRSVSGVFRLPIDRIFTIKGFGTVVTGTMLCGHLKKGMTVHVFPKGEEAKVRGIQVYNQAVEEAMAGQRAAINLHGVEKGDLERGDVLSLPSYLQPTYLLDGRLHLLPSISHSLKNRTRIRFHTGTSEVLARVILLDAEELEPGHEALVQFQLEAPLAVMAGDPFVIRFYSPIITIGGGKIIDSFPVRHRRFDRSVLQGLNILEGEDDLSAVEFLIHESRYQGTTAFRLGTRLNKDENQIIKQIEELNKKNCVVVIDALEHRVIHQDFFKGLLAKAVEILADFHHRFPLELGMSREELRSRLYQDLESRLYTLIISALLEQGRIVVQEKNVRLTTHRIQLSQDEEREKIKILETYHQAAYQPPNLAEVLQGYQGKKIDIARLIKFLVDDGLLVRLNEELLFHHEILGKIRQCLEAYLINNAEISVADFKELFGISRKYAISLLEYFDAVNFTLRLGDKRILKKRKGV